MIKNQSSKPFWIDWLCEPQFECNQFQWNHWMYCSVQCTCICIRMKEKKRTEELQKCRHDSNDSIHLIYSVNYNWVLYWPRCIEKTTLFLRRLNMQFLSLVFFPSFTCSFDRFNQCKCVFSFHFTAAEQQRDATQPYRQYFE